MKYQALYRKYRPKTFDDVYGQEIIVKTLKNVIKNNKLTHAYLFIGPRGTGKTSIAKIFAKTINCLNSENGISCEKCEICKNNNLNENVDIIEMDAASNNGVDEIREIKNHVTLLPTISKYKIYIIDEVHMLTTGAFNALLKTLEEPPKHVIFILATTEPHKIPLTIISRCQSFEFKPIPKNIIKERLKYICNEENIKIDDESLNLIAIDSNGGMRDAIGLLDQLNAYSNSDIKYSDVLLLNGRISTKEIKKIMLNIRSNNLEDTFDITEKIEDEGKNFIYICEDIIKFLRDELILYQTDKSSKFIEEIGKDRAMDIILLINKTIIDMKNSKDKKIFFDILIMKINEIFNKNQTNVCVKNECYKYDKEEIKEKTKINKSKEIFDTRLYQELMDIRLNNILSSANKQSLEEYKQKISSIENNITNLNQLKIANILMECEITAGSKFGVIITTEIQNLLNDMYKEYKEIDKIISEVVGRNVYVCILLTSFWKEKRIFYVNKIKNKEKIELIDEENVVKKIDELYNNKSKNEFTDLLEIGGE